MGYARHIGRIGALAVTLGVGVALASTPPVAYADPAAAPAGDSSSTTSSSSKTTPSSKKTSEAGNDATSTDGQDGTAASGKDPKSPSDSADKSTVDSGAGTDTEEGAEDPGEGSTEDSTGDEGDGDTPPATGDEDTPPAEVESGDDDTVKDSGSGDSPDQQVSIQKGSTHIFAVPNASHDVDPAITTTAGLSAGRQQAQTFSLAAVDDNPATYSFASPSADARTTASTMLTAAAAAPSAPQQSPTLVGIVTDFVAAVLQPFMGSGTVLSFPASLLLGALSLVRNEIERSLVRRTAPVASQYTVSQIAGPTLSEDPNPNVLLIGVDGTNLSRILADPRNENFFDLMDDSTTAASSIVGHTTISNPSWSAILTGVWGERTGVINNVFTPWTYDKWPTVFNQLETHNENIDTTTIADWDVINAISGAGSIPVDTNIYVPQIEGDTNWSQTDDAVGIATVEAIENTATGKPTFLFSYFVGVDENGHLHGGASPEYADAIVNVDDNLGDILDAVDAWEAAHPTEGEWTIIVVTDHGHQPQQGFGHGFQTPDETATFVIANGPGFNEGWVNPDYEIVDTTPTVLTLFGAPVPTNLDGVSLTTLGPGTDPADLHQALKDMIATNHSPDFVTDIALSLRTIFATIPYYIWTLNNDGTIPIPFLGDVLYVATNIPAQLIALLTGVSGASIFPLFPPGPPSWPGQEEPSAPDTAILACAGEPGSATAVSCDAASVA